MGLNGKVVVVLTADPTGAILRCSHMSMSVCFIQGLTRSHFLYICKDVHMYFLLCFLRIASLFMLYMYHPVCSEPV